MEEKVDLEGEIQTVKLDVNIKNLPRNKRQAERHDTSLICKETLPKLTNFHKHMFMFKISE